MWFRRNRGAPDAPDPADAGVPTSVDVGSATAVGGRADNQDRCHVDAGRAVVSDGMGGHRGGARAAELSVEAVVAALDADREREPAARLVDAFGRANDAVRTARTAEVDVQEMGATLIAAVPTSAADGSSTWLVGHVGDSRAFAVRGDDETTAITVDHNRAAELVAAGVISEDRAATHPGRHLLVRAVGPDPSVDVDLVEVVLRAGDALVLATDGLFGPIDVTEIGAIVRAASSAAQAASDLVDAAVTRRTTDNVTAVVVRQLASSTG